MSSAPISAKVAARATIPGMSMWNARRGGAAERSIADQFQ